MTMLRGFAFPDDLWYSPKLMVWLRPETAGTAAAGDAEGDLLTLGLSALANATAGEILVFAARPLGAAIEAGRAIGNVETAKTVSSVRTPIGGRIVAVHAAVEQDGQRIHRDPYANWLVRLAPLAGEGPFVDRLAACGLLRGAAAMQAIADEMAAYRVGE